MKTLLVSIIAFVVIAFSPAPVHAGDDGNNGHGNDPDGHDESNPGNPEIGDDENSADFLADQISQETGWHAEKVKPYSRKLAETLSQLSPAAQHWVFFGS